MMACPSPPRQRDKRKSGEDKRCADPAGQLPEQCNSHDPDRAGTLTPGTWTVKREEH